MHGEKSPKQIVSLSLNQVLWLICLLKHSEINLIALRYLLNDYFLSLLIDFFLAIQVAADCCPPRGRDNTREAAVVPSAMGRKGLAVGPGQLSPAGVARAILPLQVCREAYLQVFLLKQTAHRCRGYLQHRLNLFYKY